jgi:hypothetical protein
MITTRGSSSSASSSDGFVDRGDAIPPSCVRLFCLQQAESGDDYLYCIPHEALGMIGTIRVVE